MRKTHKCPRRSCPRQVPNRLFACPDDWFALTQPTRVAIEQTAGLPLLAPERRAAIEDALTEYRQLEEMSQP